MSTPQPRPTWPLTVHARLRAGETILVAGAAGHVGRAVTVLAHAAGARVIATASAKGLETCLRLGAYAAIDYRDPDWARRVREAAPPTGIDVHLDTSGRHDLGTAVEMLAHRGRILLMAGLATPCRASVGALYGRDAPIRGFAISNARAWELAAAARRTNELVSQGILAGSPLLELPLSAAAEAHARLESGRAAGIRLVLRPP